MERFEQQQGIAFLLIFYSHRNEAYYLRYEKLMSFWNRAEAGGRKSFRYEELEERYFLSSKGGILIPYLDAIQKDLEERG